MLNEHNPLAERLMENLIDYTGIVLFSIYGTKSYSILEDT